MSELRFNVGKLGIRVGSIIEENAANVLNKQKFLNYIDTELQAAWDTDHGREAIAELRSFVENEFQNYIDYLNEKARNFEEVISKLKRINNW